MPRFERFLLPDAGEGLTEADIVTWRVAEGDRIEINQPLVEIETAKSLVELPSPFEGVVTRLLAAEGESPTRRAASITVITDWCDAVASAVMITTESLPALAPAFASAIAASRMGRKYQIALANTVSG